MNRIALLGQPNSGKSTIYNNLTGARQHVGNWAGKTVEKNEGTYTYDGTDYSVTYSNNRSTGTGKVTITGNRPINSGISPYFTKS